MLKEEPALNPQTSRAFRVPDASSDSFDVLTALGAAVATHGGTVLTYHEVIGLDVEGGRVKGATVRNKRTGEESRLAAAMVINAAGAWAGQIAGMAGCPVTVRPSKGTMVAMAYRFVNTIINRCHLPGDGDILVPVGTVAVIGTTSVNVPDPNDTSIQAWEVAADAGRGREDGARVQPGARAAGVGGRPAALRGRRQRGRAARPSAPSPCSITQQRDGVGGLVTVVGGKFTTYRLMAERAADVVCAQLGVTKPCVTKEYVLPDARQPLTGTKPHWLGHRLAHVEEEHRPGQLDLRVRAGHPLRHRERGRPAPRSGRALGAGRPAPRPAAGHGTVPGRLLRLSGRRASCTKSARGGRRAGHRRAGRLRAAALEGPAARCCGARACARRCWTSRSTAGFSGWIDWPSRRLKRLRR